MIDYDILAEVRKEKGVTWGYLESVINGYRGKFTDYKKQKTTLTDWEEEQLSSVLGVPLEYLQGKTSIKEQKNKPTTESDELNLSESEKELLKAFRALQTSQKEMILRAAGVPSDDINLKDL